MSLIDYDKCPLDKEGLKIVEDYCGDSTFEQELFFECATSFQYLVPVLAKKDGEWIKLCVKPTDHKSLKVYQNNECSNLPLAQKLYTTLNCGTKEVETYFTNCITEIVPDLDNYCFDPFCPEIASTEILTTGYCPKGTSSASRQMVPSNTILLLMLCLLLVRKLL